MADPEVHGAGQREGEGGGMSIVIEVRALGRPAVG